MSHLSSPTQPIKFRTHGNSQRLFDLDRNLRHTRLSPYFVLISGKGLGKQAANSSDCQDILSVSFLPSTLSLSLIVWAFKRTLSCVMLLIVCAYSVHSLGEKTQEPYSRRNHFEAGTSPASCARVWCMSHSSNKRGNTTMTSCLPEALW